MTTYTKYTSVGCYPCFVVWEGECYCADCANKFAQEEQDDPDMTDDERIFSCPEDAGISEAINWEDPDLYCSGMHGCGESIESAYAEDEVEESQ